MSSGHSVVPLSRWFEPGSSGAPDRVVAFGREGARSAEDLRRDVASLAARVGKAANESLLLHCDDAYAFAVGLLASAQLGARAVLPPSRASGAIGRLAPELCGALLDGDPQQAPADLPCWHPLEGAGEVAAADLAPLDRDAPLAALFTSGTTGAGRRVEKAVRHLEDEVAVLERHFGSRLGAGTPVLATVAPQHLYGLLFRVLWPLASGRPFLRSAVLHPEELAPHAEAAAAFAVVTTPATLRHLVARGDLARRGRACRALFSSGGPLDAELARRAFRAFGAAPVEVYGSTETGGVAVRQQREGGEAWQPLSGVTTELDGQSGCLAVTSPFVSAGAAVAGGRMRFVTGDRARLSAEGAFTLLGRADRVVKVGEKRLSLPDMEARLAGHEGVEEAALIALGKRGAEARIAAAVVPTAAAWDAIADGGRRAMAKTLGEHLAPDFERVLLPRAWRFLAALPRDVQGKVSAEALAGLFAREVERVAPERLASEREGGVLSLHLRIPHDLSFLDGHFPSQPVVSGIAQLHLAMGALGELLGAPPAPSALEALKFHEVLLPGSEVRLRVELDADGERFRFTLADAARPSRLHASGRGRLGRAS